MTRAVPSASYFTRAFAGGAVAAVVNVLLRFGAQATGVSMEGAFAPGRPVAVLSIPPIVVASIVPAIPAALLALLLQRFTKRPALVFTVISVVLAVISFGGPVGVVGASVGTKLTMDLMHVSVALGVGGSVAGSPSSSRDTPAPCSRSPSAPTARRFSQAARMTTPRACGRSMHGQSCGAIHEQRTRDAKSRVRESCTPGSGRAPGAVGRGLLDRSRSPGLLGSR